MAHKSCTGWDSFLVEGKACCWHRLWDSSAEGMSPHPLRAGLAFQAKEKTTAMELSQPSRP